MGLIGYVATLLAFNQSNTSAKWRHELDREGAIAKARETASKFGVETNGWTALVNSGYDRTIENEFARGHTRHPAS
jgi:hypothetical protein